MRVLTSSRKRAVSAWSFDETKWPGGLESPAWPDLSFSTSSAYLRGPAIFLPRASVDSVDKPPPRAGGPLQGRLSERARVYAFQSRERSPRRGSLVHDIRKE